MTTRLVPLLLLALACGAVWAAFALTSGDVDTWILLAIGVTCAASVLLLIARSDRWRPQGLGLTAFLAGVGWYFGAIGARRLGWRGAFGARELDATRAAIVVGCALLLWGLGWWVWERRDRDEPAEPLYDRRSGKDRRQGWGRLR